MRPYSLNLAQLRSGLKPFRLHWFPRLRSTNEQAVLLRKRGRLFAPAVVLTGRQTAGRGRGAHTWWSGGGCLTVSFVLPVEEQLSPHQLPLVAGLAVRNAAAELTGDERIQLKWPNDVVYDGRKLAGLLCERIERVDVVGVGLNVNLSSRGQIPRHLRGSITSLSQIAGRPLDLTTALTAVGRHLYQMLARRRRQHLHTELLQEYGQHHALTGRQVTIAQSGGQGAPVTGRCTGIDQMGRLLLRAPDRGDHLLRIVSGHVLSVGE